jgi:glycosyltransferase involved in cell wall biosynthesis
MEGLRRNGFEVIECHQQLWHGTEDRVYIASGGWLKPSFWSRVFLTYWSLIRSYLQLGEYDILMVGYPGHIDVYIARVLSWIRKKPMTWDVLNSLYLIGLERGLNKTNPLTLKFIKFFEKIACRLPDMLFLDTEEFINWFKYIYNVNPNLFRIVPIGADDRYFRITDIQKTKDNLFRVIYYGSYIPNHGVEYIIESANLLKDHPEIQFEMIGEGPDLELALSLVETYDLKNIKFIRWKKLNELVIHIANSDLILGVFGTSKQVTLTNNNKIYEGFAMGKPVISGESPALPSQLINGIHLYLCERGCPQALADGILTLKSQPELRETMAQVGLMIFHKYFDVTSIGKQITNHIKTLYD